MHERLVESWLDSASERSYQVPFCQMLSSNGHRIIHSSRHSPIELGKDIISINTDNIPCAYQLKSSPNGRLTLTEYRSIESQLFQLITYPINDPSLKMKPHLSFLVTNGLVEEEARLAIDALNMSFIRDGFPNRKLEIIQRGDLLQMAKDMGHTLWPTELDKVNLLLELLIEDGKGLYPIKRLHGLLIELLKIDEKTIQGSMSDQEIKRRITSAAVLVSVSQKNFQINDNYYAIISSWVLFCSYTIAMCERYNKDFSICAQAAVELAMIAIKDNLLSLAKETIEKEILVEGNHLVDFVTYKARYTLVLSLLSILWFWCEEDGWPNDLNRDSLETLLKEGLQHIHFWGEAAVPQLLSYYWFLRRTNPSSNTEFLLASIQSGLLQKKNCYEMVGLPSPYFFFEDVCRHILAEMLGKDNDPMRYEHSGSMSFFTESIFLLLVRTGRKDTCRRLWPDTTRMSFISFYPASKWQYCLSLTEFGEYIQKLPSLTTSWSDLVSEARKLGCDEAPYTLRENRFLFILFLILFPYRGTTSAITLVARKFDRTWFIDPPIEH